MARTTACCGLLAVLFVCAGCGSKSQMVKGKATAEPDYVAVQHILIGFQGTVPGKIVTRTKAEAELLARDLLHRAKAGEDFDQLVSEYTDDEEPGIYDLANNGMVADRDLLVHPRAEMAAAFGDVAFSLKIDEIGMTYYDSADSKYGYHIIKRLK